MSAGVPQRIAVEGPIGVGKTSLAQRLGDALGYALLLEKAEENPFLERFYQDQRGHALPTQLHFLLQRAQQLQALACSITQRRGLPTQLLCETRRLAVCRMVQM